MPRFPLPQRAARPAATLFTVLLLTNVFGCAAVPLATAGTIAGIAAAGVDTGTELYNLGKLDATHFNRFDEVVDAVRIVADDARLTLKGASSNEPGWLCPLVYADDRGSDLVVTVERRTETLTRSRIDVGLFGSQTTARLFLTHMRLHLPSETAGPVGPSRRDADD